MPEAFNSPIDCGGTVINIENDLKIAYEQHQQNLSNINDDFLD